MNHDAIENINFSKFTYLTKLSVSDNLSINENNLSQLVGLKSLKYKCCNCINVSLLTNLIELDIRIIYLVSLKTLKIDLMKYFLSLAKKGLPRSLSNVYIGENKSSLQMKLGKINIHC